MSTYFFIAPYNRKLGKIIHIIQFFRLSPKIKSERWFKFFPNCTALLLCLWEIILATYESVDFRIG